MSVVEAPRANKAGLNALVDKERDAYAAMVKDNSDENRAAWAAAWDQLKAYRRRLLLKE